jgi:hypothetical protein
LVAATQGKRKAGEEVFNQPTLEAKMTKLEAKAKAIAALKDPDGRVRPERVVEAARDKKSPLHGDYLWDVKEAAEAHWLETAKRQIREVRLVVVTANRKVICPFYVTDPSKSENESAYVETQSLTETTVAERVILAELDRIVGAVERARAVAAVIGVDDHLEDLLAGTLNLREKVRERLAA